MEGVFSDEVDARLPGHRKQKKSRRGGTPRRYSTTSAYSSTSPPARPGCHSPSHPTVTAMIRLDTNRASALLFHFLSLVANARLGTLPSRSARSWKGHAPSAQTKRRGGTEPVCGASV